MPIRKSWPLAPLWLVLSLACGCSRAHTSSRAATQLNGNWTFAAPANQNNPTPLTLNAGMTTQVNGTVTAVARLAGAACITATTPIQLSGAVNDHNQVTLTSQPFAGTTLKLSGTVSADGKTISSAAWKFLQGSCASLGSSTVAATQYAQINGTYSGTFTDVNNNQFPVQAALTQTTQPDQNGQFHLSGSATFPDNPCFTQPLITDSLVTGSALSTTYTQGNESITAVGTFNSDATQLTVTDFQVAGGLCHDDYGTGILTKQ